MTNIFRQQASGRLRSSDLIRKSYSTASTLVATRAFFELQQPITAAVIKVWNGSSWVTGKPVKIWDGATWNVKPLKVWSGSTWITAT